MDNDRLYIPYGLSVEQEFISGFGKTELMHFLIGFAFSAAIGAVLLLFTGNFLTMAVPLIIGSAGSFIMTRKDPVTRASVVGQIVNIVRFANTQKRYYYVYKSIWDTK